MITTTISSSISVKPLRSFEHVCGILRREEWVARVLRWVERRALRATARTIPASNAVTPLLTSIYLSDVIDPAPTSVCRRLLHGLWQFARTPIGQVAAAGCGLPDVRGFCANPNRRAAMMRRAPTCRPPPPTARPMPCASRSVVAGPSFEQAQRVRDRARREIGVELTRPLDTAATPAGTEPGERDTAPPSCTRTPDRTGKS